MDKGNYLEYFMWGFQQHMQISLQTTAEQVFNEIDHKLNPKVFFLGVLAEELADRHPICIEPLDCGFHPGQFKDLTQLAENLSRVSEDAKIMHTHPIAEANHKRGIQNRAYMEGIKKIIGREYYADKEEFYVSYPTYVGGYLVFTVLSLNKEALNNHYSLTKDKFDRFKILKSFIDATIDVFLKECATALKDPENSIQSINRTGHEIISLAGKQFMYTVANAGGNFYGLHGLHDACNAIASLKYEGSIGLGSMIVAKADHKNVKLTLQLEHPIPVQDFRLVRKFLEVATNDTAIITDTALIYGLGEVRGKYNPKDENLFVISFTSHFRWEVLHDNNPMMVVEYRQPALPKEKIDKDKFYSDLTRIFKGITKGQVDDLWDITIESTNQKHGTMLVIADHAEAEAKRLGNQSFPLKPLKLSRTMISQVTSIDGAVLLNRNAECQAIGVILDGLATQKGDPSRGARYNSAIRYYEQFHQEAALAIVIISEDGMINVIPSLRPQINHRVVEDAIKDFKEILDEEELQHKQFNLGMNWFQHHRFYLTQEECDIVNNTRREIEEKFADDLWNMRIVYEDLKPHPEMNDSYYSN